MCDLAASLLESVFALFDNGIRCGFVLEPDDGRLLLINGEDAGNNCKRSSDKGEESHAYDSAGDDFIE
ncbi:hypothetical protein HG531_011117 [Fusarium graminearum]|nr:hypothetical protein HG531_011117 [Fusarium graminearum]